MQQAGGSEAQVTWEDQQNINKFGRLNNRFHELEEEIKIAKCKRLTLKAEGVATYRLQILNLHMKDANENLEDANNELILLDEETVRFQTGEVFAHIPREEVEARLEQMKEASCKDLERLEGEKESVVSQMAALKKILYGKFKDSINLEED